MDGPAADTDPNVSYTYGYGLTGDAATYARLEKITLPGGRQVYYNYESQYESLAKFASLNRVANIAANDSPDDANTYVAYKYLGASTVVDANHPAVPTGLRLTYGTSANKYPGLGPTSRLSRYARPSRVAEMVGQVVGQDAVSWHCSSSEVGAAVDLQADMRAELAQTALVELLHYEDVRHHRTAAGLGPECTGRYERGAIAHAGVRTDECSLCRLAAWTFRQPRLLSPWRCGCRAQRMPRSSRHWASTPTWVCGRDQPKSNSSSCESAA